MATRLDDEDDIDDPLAPPPRVTVTRPAQRSVDVWDQSQERFDPRQLTNPVTRRLFGGDIARAERAAELRRREREADAADADRQALADQKAQERARREAEAEELKRVNAAREAEFRTQGVEQYTDAYGVIQPVRHPDGRPRFQVGADGYRVLSEGKDPVAGHFRVRLDAYGDQTVEDANEYRVFEDDPGHVYRGGPESSKKPNDKTGWEKMIGVDDALDSDSPSLRAAAQSARGKLRERLLGAAIAPATEEIAQSKLGLDRWRSERATAMQRLKEIEAQTAQLATAADETTGGFLGFGKTATHSAEHAKKQIADLQAEEQALRDRLGDNLSEEKAIEYDPEAAGMVATRRRRENEIAAFRDLAGSEKDVFAAARKFRELLPESERASHPILQALEREKKALGLRDPHEIPTDPKERESALQAIEATPIPGAQDIVKKAREIDSRAAALNGTGAPTDPVKAQAEADAINAESESLNAEWSRVLTEAQKQAEERQAQQARQIGEKRLAEANALSAAREFMMFNADERALKVPSHEDFMSGKAAAKAVSKALQSPEEAAAQRAEKLRPIEGRAGGPDMIHRWVEHMEMLDQGRWGISPATREFVVSDAVYSNPAKLDALKDDIRGKRIPGIATDVQVAEALDLVDERVKQDEIRAIKQASSLPGWEDAKKAAGPNATDAEVLAKWKEQGDVWGLVKKFFENPSLEAYNQVGKAGREIQINAARKLGGGAVSLVEGALAGGNLWIRDKANAVAEWSGQDWLKTSPEKFGEILLSALDPKQSWSGAVGGEPNPRLDGVLSETGNIVGQQLPGWLAAYALSKVPGGRGSAALAQNILMGATYGLQNAASNYSRVFESLVQRDESGAIVGNAEAAHQSAMDSFIESFAVGVSELAPIARVFEKIPMNGMLGLVGKIGKGIGEEVAQEVIAQKLNNVITAGHSGGAAAPEELTPQMLAAMTFGMSAVIAPAVILKHRRQAQWLTKNAASIQAVEKQADAIPAAWEQYRNAIAPTEAAIQLGALSPTDPEVTAVVKDIGKARAVQAAAKDLESRVAATEALHATITQHAATLDRLGTEGPKSANLNEIAAQIDALDAGGLIQRAESKGIPANQAAQLVTPQYVQRQKDRVAGLVKVATGRKDLLTKAEEQAIATDHLGNPVELVYEHDGVMIVEERARKGLIDLIPAAEKLFPTSEGKRKMEATEAKKAEEVQAKATKGQKKQPKAAPPPLESVEEDQIPMGDAPAVEPASPQHAAAIQDIGDWYAKHGIPPEEAVAFAQEYGQGVSKMRTYDRRKHFWALRPRLAEFAQAKGYTLGKDGNFVKGEAPPPPGKPKPTDPPRSVTEQKVKKAVAQATATAPEWVTKVITFSPGKDTDGGGMWVDTKTGKLHIDIDRLNTELDEIPSEQHEERLALQIDEEITHVVQIQAAKNLYRTEKKPGESFPAFLERYYGDIWRSEFSQELRDALTKLRGETQEDDWQRAMEGIRALIQQRKSGTQTEALGLFVRSLGAKAKKVLQAMLDLFRQAAASGKGFGKRVQAEIGAIEAILARESGNGRVDDARKLDQGASVAADDRAAQPETQPLGGQSSAESKPIRIDWFDPGSIEFKESEQERGRVEELKAAYAGDQDDIAWDDQPLPILSNDNGSIRVEDGHHRITAWRELGFTKIQAIVVPLKFWKALEERYGLAKAGASIADALGHSATVGQSAYQGGGIQDISKQVAAINEKAAARSRAETSKPTTVEDLAKSDVKAPKNVDPEGFKADRKAEMLEKNVFSYLRKYYTPKEVMAISASADPQLTSALMDAGVMKGGKFEEGSVVEQDEVGNQRRSQIGWDTFEAKWATRAWELRDAVKRFEAAKVSNDTAPTIDAQANEVATSPTNDLPARPPRKQAKKPTTSTISPGDTPPLEPAEQPDTAQGSPADQRREAMADQIQAAVEELRTTKDAGKRAELKARIDQLKKDFRAKKFLKEPEQQPAEQPADPAQARLQAAKDKLRALKDKSGGKLSSASLTGNPDFYSRLERAVETADFGRSQPKTPHHWAGVIQKWARGWSSAGGSLWREGISQDEIKWSGIMQWLMGQKGPLTKADVLAYLRDEGRVTFEEVRHSDPLEDVNGDGPKGSYKPWSLPGGENYREVVLAMPAANRLTELQEKSSSGRMTEEEQREYRRLKQSGEAVAPTYTSTHFSNVPNYIAHYRAQDFGDGTVIEELQSDRHQKGRKDGYREDQRPPTDDEVREFFGLEEAAHPADYRQEMINKTSGRVPDAPYRKTWPLALFKRALREAVESGKNWIGWPVGAIHADRYDLSKQISAVGYSGTNLEAFDKDGKTVIKRTGVLPEDLPDIIGKEAAERLLAAPKRGTLRMIEGEDLRVGGEGQLGFYDDILPKEVGRYVRQWGAQVEKRTERIKNPVTKKMGVPMWRVDITPAMRESVQKGQSLFSASLRPDAETLAVYAEVADAAFAAGITTPEAFVQTMVDDFGGDIGPRTLASIWSFSPAFDPDQQVLWTKLFAEATKPATDKESLTVEPEAPAEVTPSETPPVPAVLQAEEAKSEKKKQATAPSDITLREQKKYLLEQIDIAIKEAPKAEDANLATDAGADIINFKASVGHYKQGETAEQFTQRRREELVPLFEKYGVTYSEDSVTNDVGTAEDRGHLLDAIELAHMRQKPRVVIEVPGDGTFKIINTKETLTEFKKRAAKFPTSVPKPQVPSSAPLSDTGKVPALGKPKTIEDHAAAITGAISDDETRYVLNYVRDTGEELVATDGKRLIRVEKDSPKREPAWYDRKGKKAKAPMEREVLRYERGQPIYGKEKGEAEYPNFRQVIPQKKNRATVFKGLDTARLFTVLSQARSALKGNAALRAAGKAIPTIRIFKNPDDSLGVETLHNPEIPVPETADEGIGGYEHNIQKGTKLVANYSVDYLIDLVDAARRLGHEKIDLLLGGLNEPPPQKEWHMVPAVLEAPGLEMVIMPVRTERDNPDPLQRIEVGLELAELKRQQAQTSEETGDESALPTKTTTAPSVAPTAAPKWKDAIIDVLSLAAFHNALYRGETTPEAVRAAWEWTKANIETLTKDLGRMTMKELERFQGMRKPDNKSEAVRQALMNFITSFNSTGSYSIDPMGGNLIQKTINAIDPQVAGWTAEKLAKVRQDRADAKAASEKALTNPETKEEWEKFVYSVGRKALTPDEVKEILKIRSGFGRNEAVRAKGESLLTPEQLAAYDAVRWIDRKAQEEAEAKRNATVRGVQAGTTSEIVETKHTKTGEDLFVVRLADRVERDTYNALNIAAKKLGGWYSSYRGSGAVPGFQFKSRDRAEQFQAVVNGETVDRSEQIEEKKERRQSAAADKLRETANNMTRAADESLNADRKTNTRRRADQVGHAEAKALDLKATADTMRNIADAIENGNVTHLDGVTSRTHIETLDSLARMAKIEAERADGMTYSQTESVKHVPPKPEQMALAKYPYPYLDTSTLMQMAQEGLFTPGAKQIAQRVLKIRLEDPRGTGTGGYLMVEDQIADVEALAKKVRQRGKPYWDDIKWKFDSYKRVQAMGLTDLPSLRAALREFTEFRGKRQQADPLKEMERALVGQKIPGFFPTPPVVIDRMLDEAGDLDGKRVLEPSAGKGDIAEAAKERGAEVEVIEQQSSLRDILEAKGMKLVGRDFMDKGPEDYDVVLMNPPFEDGQDMAHVRHAWDFVKPGGKLVAITSAGPFFRQDSKATAFREWLESVGGIHEELPEGSFRSAFRPTGVSTHLVTIQKPARLASAPLDRGRVSRILDGSYEPDVDDDLRARSFEQAIRASEGNRAAFGGIVPQATPRPYQPSGSQRLGAALVTELSGRTPVFFRRRGPIAPGGLTVGGDAGAETIIGINREDTGGAHLKAGHEMWHWLQLNRKSVANRIGLLIERSVPLPMFETARSEFTREYGPDADMHEVAANILGTALTDPLFWHRYRSQNSARIAQAIEGLAENPTYSQARLVTDWPAFVRGVAQIMQEDAPRLSSAPLHATTDLGTWAETPLRVIGVPEAVLNRGTVALARWAGRVMKSTGRAVGIPQAVGRMTGTQSGQKLGQALRIAQKELIPRTLIPREAAAWIQEAKSGIAWSARENEDLMRTIRAGGASKYQDGFFVPPEGTDPDVQREMSRYFRGEIPIDELPEAVHDWARSLTKLWDERGKRMVEAGIMSWETYSARRAAPNNYFPHLYVTEEMNNTGVRWAAHKLKMVLDRVKPQLSTAWYISERNPSTGEPVTDRFGVPKLLNHSGKAWRFNSEEHRDQWFEGYVRNEIVARVRRHAIDFTLEDLDALELQSPETAALVASIEQDIRARWKMGEPTDLETLERAGLITNLAYVVPKSLAQMDHDIFLAHLFKKIADEPRFTSDAPIAGYTEVPNDHRFGKLAGRYVEDSIAQEILELHQATELAWQIYDASLAEWKKWKTVYNPGTHVRNVIGNFFFADLAGIGVENPANWGYYRDAWRAIKGDLPEATLPELYSLGVLGGDFASAELDSLLKTLPLEDPRGNPKNALQTMLRGAWKLGKVGGQKMRSAYELEDALFKVAAYLKARKSGMAAEESAAHVRKWFPYYDQVGRSTTIRMAKRFTSPFLSFMQEALRIGGLAAMEKPITFAKWLAIPSLISAIGRYVVGVDDDEWEAIERGMRGRIGDTAIFAALLPWEGENGKIAQLDLTNVIPYADMLGKRMGTAEDLPMISAMIHKYFMSGPLTQLAIAWGQARDPFTGREFRQTDMTAGDVLKEQAKYTGRLILPPLTPGIGTSDLISTFTQPERQGRFLRERSRPMEVARKLFGIDVRPANPDLYASADAFRKARGLPSTPDFSDSTAKSRARASVFSALVNGDVDRLAESLVELRSRTGESLRTPQDMNRLFFYRNPTHAFSKREDREAWIRSLTPIEKRELDRAIAQFEQARRNAIPLIRHAEAKRPELKVPLRQPLATQ